MSWLTYYFSVGGMSALKKFADHGIKADVLVSFAHMTKDSHKHCERVIGYRKQAGTKVMLDSGAFTNFQKPGTVTLEMYREFLKAHAPCFDEMITLDDIKQKKNTLINFDRLKKDGHKVMLVDDMRDGSQDVLPEFIPHYKREEKMCLSGWGKAVDAAGEQMKKPQGMMQQLGKRIEAARTHKVSLHLLAVGSLSKFLPHLDRIASVDSAAWGRGPGYGQFMVCSSKPLGGLTVPVLRAFDSPECQAPKRAAPRDVMQLFNAFKAKVGKGIGGMRTIIELFCVAQIKHYIKQLNKIGAEALVGAFTREKQAMGKSRAAFFLPISLDEGMLPDVWDVAMQMQWREEDAVAKAVEVDPDGDEVFVQDDDGSLVRITTERIVPGQVEVEKEQALTKQVPPTDASTEDKREAQKVRAKEFGIEALEGKGERLAFPAGYPKDLKMYGDPVNLMYPLDPAGRARNARARFKQFAGDGYKEDASKRIVHSRIIRRLLELGAKPSFDEDDPLDKLLPQDLQDKLQEQEGAKDQKQARDVTLLPVEKADEDRNIVFGVVLEPDSVDAQGDTIDPDEIERASHLWLARFQDRGLQHEKIVNSRVEIYESYIAPTDLTLGGQKVKKGTWLLMLHVLDKALWAEIKSGKFTGFSMGGFARRVRT